MPMVAAMASVVIVTTSSTRVKPAVFEDPRSPVERSICYPLRFLAHFEATETIE